ncbi:MAG: ATP-binding protein, partial [Defluviitaleaceae bacterium]|nr:ATP-binding protein [Defluviitaleaceae bacterium]
YNFFYWYATAPDISFMFIDEFDAYYHFELSEAIVNLLGKLTKTQVLLTSHNTNLLTNLFMRPDCLFILTPEKLSNFANATSRELREGHNLEKLYMSGEFNGQ